jgi:hypothetical protein
MNIGSPMELAIVYVRYIGTMWAYWYTMGRVPAKIDVQYKLVNPASERQSLHSVQRDERANVELESSVTAGFRC